MTGVMSLCFSFCFIIMLFIINISCKEFSSCNSALTVALRQSSGQPSVALAYTNATLLLPCPVWPVPQRKWLWTRTRGTNSNNNSNSSSNGNSSSSRSYWYCWSGTGHGTSTSQQVDLDLAGYSEGWWVIIKNMFFLALATGT